MLARKVAETELLGFLYPLLEGLLDRQFDSADGSCVVINGIFRLRGAELENETDAIIDALHAKVRPHLSPDILPALSSRFLSCPFSIIATFLCLPTFEMGTSPII